MKTCPQCGSQTNELIPVDTSTRVALESTGHKDIPAFACNSCHENLGGKISHGMKLIMERKAKEEQRVSMWKNRVLFVKKGRQLMSAKNFSQAAVNYEKYIRVLEVAHELKAGELNPGIFDKTYRSKEITVITSVYWDLLRIYDGSPSYKDRMQKTANKLAMFAPRSTIMPDIIKKTESFSRKAKNQAIVKGLLRKVKNKSGKCFIATSAFDSPVHPDVLILRQWRDQFLRQNPLGRRFIAFYYKNSPQWADWLDAHGQFKPAVRFILSALSHLLSSRLKNKK